MYTISEGETKETTKGREHKGTYGTSHGKEDVRDQYGHKVGKIDKGAADKKDAPKKGRGRPKKGSDDSGEVKSYDTKSLGDVFGGGKKPSKEVGKKSVKHSLKDWIEASEQKSLNEDGQFVTKPIPQQNTQLQQVIGPDGRPALNQPIPTSAALRVASALSSSDGTQGMAEEGKGLWANIHAKRKRIKNGSNERMRKPGSKGAPTASALKKSATEDVAKDLPGDQDNLDVAPPKGKLTRDDFRALRTKKKVKESLSFNEMMGETNDEMQDMLAELQQDIEHFNTTGHCSDKLQAFLNIHGHAKKKMTDEGQHTQHYLDANKPSTVRQHAEIAQAPKQHTPWKADPISAASNMATDVAQSMGKKTSGFLKSLSPFSMTESKNMKDIQLENWEKELNSLLNEGITVSSSTGQQGSPDSVDINATDADAQELLAIIRQAGLGVFGGDKPQSNYGAPMHDNPEGHGTEPEMSPTVVGDDNDMLALIKKMTGISMGGEKGSMGHGSDYEDEEGSEDTALQPADGEEEHDSEECETCGQSPCGCDDEDLNERMPLPKIGADGQPDPADMQKLQQATTSREKMSQELSSQSAGNSAKPDTSKPTTPNAPDTSKPAASAAPNTNEDDMEEGNDFTEKLKKTPKGGKFSIGGKQYTDTSNIEEGWEAIQEDGMPGAGNKEALAKQIYDLGMSIHTNDRIYNQDDPEGKAQLAKLKAQFAQQFPGEDAFKLGSTISHNDYQTRQQQNVAQAKQRPAGIMQKAKNALGGMFENGEETCNECGGMMYEGHTCEEQVEEGFSNDAGGDAMGDTELMQLKALLSMGGDLHKMKSDQTVGNPTRVSVRESLNEWKKLSGIK
jgi:hypothetical protein